MIVDNGLLFSFIIKGSDVTYSGNLQRSPMKSMERFRAARVSKRSSGLDVSFATETS
jgi:hypothetical protein